MAIFFLIFGPPPDGIPPEPPVVVPPPPVVVSVGGGMFAYRGRKHVIGHRKPIKAEVKVPAVSDDEIAELIYLFIMIKDSRNE